MEEESAQESFRNLGRGRILAEEALLGNKQTQGQYSKPTTDTR